MSKRGFVYLLANRKNGTLYIGVTSDLLKRVLEHKMGAIKGFTRRYNVTQLMYFEVYDKMIDALKREKQLKSWHRAWKINLIEQANEEWRDLYFELVHQTRKM